MSLSTCYNALGFGWWEELCHEYMASVLPTADPRMPVDDLSSPMWRIIFLKDDCFLQPSCEVTCPSSDSDSLANTCTSSSNGKLDAGAIANTTITTATIMATTTNAASPAMDNYDHHDPTTCPSSNPIEPLFEGIDLNHHHHHHHHSYKDAQQKPRSTTSFDSDTQHHELVLDMLPPSPSLSRSSSLLTISDVEQESYQQQQQQQQKKKHPTVLIKPIKRKRKNSTTQRQSQKQQQQKQKQKRHRQKKQQIQPRHAKNGSGRLPTTTMALEMTNTTTLFQQLSYAGIDWCRYCGTTEGVNWRPGPWGKRTLCNKHGCDYKGYGLASRLPRLDLSGYRHELVQDRHRPVVQEFCTICQDRGTRRTKHYNKKVDDYSSSMMDSDDDDDDDEDLALVTCDGGCSRAFHRQCFHISNTRHGLWFCSPSCSDNRRKNRVVVDLPRKQPLMRL